MVLYSETTYPSRTRFLATSVFAKFETLQREEPKTINQKRQTFSIFANNQADLFIVRPDPQKRN